MKTITILFFLSFSLVSFAQTESSVLRDFEESFLDNYKELSKPPLNNCFVILNNAAKVSFTLENSFYKKALSIIQKENKINELQALDTLLKRSFRHLRQKSIWVSSPKVLEKEKDFFEVYNTEICPCLTENVKKNDALEKMIDAQKNCLAKVMQDTFFISEIKAKGGNKTINDLSKLQPYFALFFYENCDILNYKFNETITNIVFEQYFNRPLT